MGRYEEWLANHPANQSGSVQTQPQTTGGESYNTWLANHPANQQPKQIKPKTLSPMAQGLADNSKGRGNPSWTRAEYLNPNRKTVTMAEELSAQGSFSDSYSDWDSPSYAREQLDRLARYNSKVSEYGSSRAWADAEQLSYDEANSEVERIADELRGLKLESTYGTAIYQDGIYMGEDAERQSWYDAQIDKLSNELTRAEYAEGMAKRNLEEATEYADYDAYKEQLNYDESQLKAAHAAGMDSEGLYQAAAERQGNATAWARELEGKIRDLQLSQQYAGVSWIDGAYTIDEAQRVADLERINKEIKENQDALAKAYAEIERRDSALAAATRTRYADISAGRDPNYYYKVAEGKLYYDAEIAPADKAAAEQRQQAERLDVISGLTTGASAVNNTFRTYMTDSSYKRPAEKWTQAEVEKYYYLVDPADMSAADEYASNLNERYAMEEKYAQTKAIEEWSGKNALTGTVASAGALVGFLASGVDAIDKLAEYSARGTITAKPYATATDLSNAVITGVKNSLNDWSGTVRFLGEDRGAGDIYSVAMSVAQSYAAIAAGGAAGSTLYFFGNGMSNGIDEALSRGAKPGQAIAYGLTSAVIEAATEKYSVDSLLSGMDISNVFLAIAKQAGVEASEEGVSYLLNRMADMVMTGNLQEYNRELYGYMMDGDSYEEAAKKASAKWMKELGWSLISGAMSGALSSSAAQLYRGASSGTGESPLVPPAQSEPKVEQSTEDTRPSQSPAETAPPEGEPRPITEQTPAITAEQNNVPSQVNIDSAANQEYTEPNRENTDTRSENDEPGRSNAADSDRVSGVYGGRITDSQGRPGPGGVRHDSGFVLLSEEARNKLKQSGVYAEVDETTADNAAFSVANNTKEQPRRERSAGLEVDELNISESVAFTAEDREQLATERRENAMAKAEQQAQKGVRSYARRLTQKLDSKKSFSAVATDLENMVRTLLHEDVAPSELREWTREIAEYVVEEAEVTVTDTQELRTELAQYLKSTPLKLERSAFGEIPEGWRKAHRQVRLSDKGLSINMAWQELGSMFGEGVFPTDIYSQSDMLLHIGDLLDNWKARQENPHAGYSEELKNEVAQEIYDTVTKRVNRAAMDALKNEHREALKDARQEERAKAQKKLDKKQEQLDKARAQAKSLREENKEIKAGMSAAVKTAIQDERTRQAEREKKQQHVKNINKTIESLSRKLSENSGKRHVPEAMKKAVAGMLSTIDTRGKQAGWKQQMEFANRMRSLALVLSTQQRMQAEEGEQALYLDLPGDAADMLAELANRVERLTEAENIFTGGGDGYVWTLSEMETEDLEELDKILSSISRAVEQANELMGMSATLDKVGNDIIREMDGRAAKKSPGGTVERMAEWDMLTPVYFFRRLGKPGEEIFKALRQGWAEFAAKTEQIIEASSKMWSEKEAKDAEKKLIEVELPWRILDGGAEGETESLRSEEREKVQFTHAQAMSLYGLYMRPQGRGHILGAGIHVADIPKNGSRQAVKQDKNYLVTDMDLIEIFNQLNDREREIAKEMSRYMSTVGGEWGNSVTMKRWGIRGYTEETYWPIKTDSRNRDARKPEKAGGESLYRLLNMGFTKPLVKNASNAVEIESAFDVFSGHMVDMAKYNTLALPLLDMMKILNYKQVTARQMGKGGSDESGSPGKYTTASVQKSLDKVYGKSAQRYWMQLMQDLNGDREGGRGIADPFGKLVSNYKAQSVGANLRVAMLQPTSYLRAGAILDNGAMLYGSTHVKGAWAEALKYSGAAKWKNLGYRDSDINANVRELIKHSATDLDKARDKGMILAEKADQLTWGALWSASKKSVEKEAERAGKKLNHEELIEQTVERFEEVIYRTQVMDSTLTRSTAMRSNEKFARYATSFMAEPTLSYNMVLDEYANIVQESKAKGFKKAAMDNRQRMLKAMLVYTSTAAASAAMASIVDAMRDDDEYESFARKWWQAFWGDKFFDGNFAGDLSLVRKIPSLKQLVSLIDGYGGGSIEQSALTAVVDAWRSLQKMMSKEESAGTYFKDNVTEWGYINAVLKGLSVLSGLPMASAARDVVAIWNSTYGTWWGSKVQTYDPGTERSIKYAFEDGALTEESARALLVSEGVSDDADAAYWKVEAWKSGDGEYSKYDALREAMYAGDKAAFDTAMAELEEHGMYHSDAIYNGVVDDVKEHYMGDKTNNIAPTLDKDEAVALLTEYGEYFEINAKAKVQEWSCYVDTGIKYGNIKEEYAAGHIDQKEAIRMMMEYGGESEQDATEKAMQYQMLRDTGWDYEDMWDLFVSGKIDSNTLYEYQLLYGSKSEESAGNYVIRWEWADGDKELVFTSVTPIQVYEEHVASTGMGKEEYKTLYQKLGTFRSDVDEKGETITGSKQRKIWEHINSLNLTVAQKDAMHLCFYSPSTLKDAPWNK